MTDPCIPASTVKSRMDVLAKLVRQGDVLDLGVVDYRQRRGAGREYLDREPTLLFRQIAEISPDVTGVDLDGAGVEHLKSKGFNAICADVQTMALGRRFDVIVAGEIIEHLESPGLFLRNMLNHINPAGVLAVTTPNPFFAKQRYKIWRHGRPQVHEDHTCWFDPITLSELLSRTGWTPYASYWARARGRAFKTWPQWLRGYFSETFMMLARPGASSAADG